MCPVNESAVTGDRVARWGRPLTYVVLGLLGVLALFLGSIIVDDLTYHYDKFDGLAAVLGGMMLAGVVVISLPWVAYLRWPKPGLLYTGIAAIVVTVVGLFALGFF